MSRIPVMQKPDGMFTNVLMVSFELTLDSGKCGLCFRRVVEIEEVSPVSMPSTETPLPSSWSAFFGPQPATSQKRREADDFDFSGFKRIQIVSKGLKSTVEEILELLRSLTQNLRHLDIWQGDICPNYAANECEAVYTWQGDICPIYAAVEREAGEKNYSEESGLLTFTWRQLAIAYKSPATSALRPFESFGGIEGFGKILHAALL
jgi:hypothetical protein